MNDKTHCICGACLRCPHCIREDEREKIENVAKKEFPSKQASYQLGRINERKRLLEIMIKEVGKHLSGSCGVTLCDDCRKLNNGYDICLEMIMKKLKKLEESD